VRDRNWPEAGDPGPKGSSAKQERDPFSEIATWKQGDRRDPVTVIINGEPVAKRKSADAITGHIRPTSRPDVDNYLKAILDAINTIVVADDAQVVEVYAKKKFSVAPKMIATIFPLDATPSNRRASR
jgi:hypothetical protein